jgi:hypothetical protein
LTELRDIYELRSSPASASRCWLAHRVGYAAAGPAVAILTGLGEPVLAESHYPLTALNDDVAILTGLGEPVLVELEIRHPAVAACCDPHRPRRAGAGVRELGFTVSVPAGVAISADGLPGL